MTATLRLGAGGFGLIRQSTSGRAAYHTREPLRGLSCCIIHQMDKKRNHGDTRISLHPLTFDEAMAKLAQAKRDSQAGVSST